MITDKPKMNWRTEACGEPCSVVRPYRGWSPAGKLEFFAGQRFGDICDAKRRSEAEPSLA